MKFKTFYKVMVDAKINLTIRDRNENYLDSIRIDYTKGAGKEMQQNILKMLKLKDSGADVQWVSVNRATGELAVDLIVDTY